MLDFLWFQHTTDCDFLSEFGNTYRFWSLQLLEFFLCKSGQRVCLAHKVTLHTCTHTCREQKKKLWMHVQHTLQPLFAAVLFLVGLFNDSCWQSNLSYSFERVLAYMSGENFYENYFFTSLKNIFIWP